MLPSNFSRSIFCYSLLYLLISGLIWKGISLWGSDSWLEVNLIILKSHGIVGPLFILSFGAVIESHVRPMLNSQKRRFSGWVLLGLGLFEIGSSLVLYYSGNDSIRSFISISHIVLGSVLALAYFTHAKRLG